MLTFDEAMAQVPTGAEKTILLGNGFSQSWDGNIFNYQNLFTQADFGAREAEINVSLTASEPMILKPSCTSCSEQQIF